MPISPELSQQQGLDLAPAAPTCGLRWLHDNVRDFDRLLLQCEQDILRRRHRGRRLEADFRQLALSSEATLLDEPLEQVRVLLGQVHHRLAWVIEMNRRSGRSTGVLHNRLSQLKQRLQLLASSLP